MGWLFLSMKPAPSSDSPFPGFNVEFSSCHGFVLDLQSSVCHGVVNLRLLPSTPRANMPLVPSVRCGSLAHRLLIIGTHPKH